MKQIASYIFEKLKINKDSSVKPNSKNLTTIEEVKKYAESLPYDYYDEIYDNSRYYTKNFLDDGFHIMYKGNGDLSLFVMFIKAGKEYKFSYVYIGNDGEYLYEEKWPKNIDSIDWEVFLDPYKYIEYLRNLRKTNINRDHISKLWELADKIEELI